MKDYPPPPPESIKHAFDRIFNSGLSLTKLRDATLANRLLPASSSPSPLCIPGRSIIWKLLLDSQEPLETASSSLFLNSLRYSRQEYKNLVLEKFRAPDGTYDDALLVPGTNNLASAQSKKVGDLERNNPLSLDNNNPWTEWFISLELRKTISQDVERTFPDFPFFRNEQVQTQLTNILFLYAIVHPDVGYRQGMHEVLAPLYLAVQYDSLDESSECDDLALKELCSRVWVGADAWVLYNHIMRHASKWYEWRESEPPAVVPAQIQSYVAPIVHVCNQIQSVKLRSVDPVLWKSLHATEIEPQIYGIRWLRLLFTREFPLQEAMRLWDAIFACDPTLQITPWICVAMLIRVRNELIPADYTEQLTTLLRYPSFAKIGESHTSLLLTQAVALQLAPTPSTGHSLVLENRNRLDIPSEVPYRRQPFRSTEGTSSTLRASSPLYSQPSANIPQYRKDSTPRETPPPRLPEILGGILEKGESLGINKTLMSAVSEIRRNIPDLNSFTRYPTDGARPPQTFNESVPSHRGSSRIDAQRELNELREMTRHVGSALTWITDALLEDETSTTSGSSQKANALQSLQYIRDTLNGVVPFEHSRLSAHQGQRRSQHGGSKVNRSSTPPSKGRDFPGSHFRLDSQRQPSDSAVQPILHSAASSETQRKSNPNSKGTRIEVVDDPLGAL